MTRVLPRRSATPSSRHEPPRRPPPLKVASTSSSMLFGNALDLVPAAPAAVEQAQAELGEVGQEDVGEVDQDRAPFIGLSATIGNAISTESV